MERTGPQAIAGAASTSSASSETRDPGQWDPVNREVAKWLEQQDDGEPSPKTSRHDTPTATVGLAGTVLSSNIYGTVVFDLTFFNKVTKLDNILRGITANVIDSCIEVIIGLPDICMHRLIHRIPSYFDTPDPLYLEFK